MTTARKRHILEEHYLDFYSRAVSILDDEDDAKDAVQEAVVKTLVRIGLRDEVSYCFRATENESINILRRRKRLQRFDISDDLGVDDRRLGRDLEEGKRLLLPLERKVLELRREHGVASQMGVSASTVKRLLAMAEKKMKYIMTHDI